MFTGLIEDVGIVRAVERGEDDTTFSVELPFTFVTGETIEIAVGDSVAHNGCCLTVIEALKRFGKPAIRVQAGHETLAKTNLGKLAVGDRVNLERALRADARLGGHFVQGHIDGTATVASVVERGDWIDMAFNLDAALAKQLVPKGSVAVDGVSLTVVDVGATSFSIMLIPHTLAETTLGDRQIGDVVNIETDVLGKYVQKFLGNSAGT
ncbi:MAG: riboflavin synthase [Planctomycetota bacterium]